jgi:tryptophan 2,3-dioxygenase
MATNNNKGPIPDKYTELQGIPYLDKARNELPVAKASLSSVAKTLFQSIEICMFNINDSWRKMNQILESCNFQDLSILAKWNRSFSKIATELTYNFENIFYCCDHDISSIDNLTRIDYESSPIYNELLSSLKQLDTSFFSSKCMDANEIIANEKIDHSIFQVLNSYRNNLHEIKLWESVLGKVHIPFIENFQYSKFVGFSFLREAVFGLKIEGETIFTQFRSLHQIPEILVSEINDHVEKSILHLRENNYLDSTKCLSISNALMEIVNNCLLPIIENLSTKEYHDIRENLGMTSGSQSENIHFHLFRDLYTQFGKEAQSRLSSCEGGSNNGSNQFYFRLESLRFKNLIRKWRDLHLHLPINHVGSNKTKSLIGANDAIDTVKNFRASAQRRDLLASLYPKNFSNNQLTMFENYLASENSYYSFLASLTGEITQNRFSNVQNRKGRFSEKIQFIPPMKRKV